MVIIGQNKSHLPADVVNHIHLPEEQMAVDEVNLISGGDMVEMETSNLQPDEEEDCDSVFYYYIPVDPMPLDLYGAIVETVALEHKYQPALTLPPVPRNSYEISARMRNGSCHVLRCLRVWYELPSDAFFLAVNTMDRFLTRMRAQPKHLSCIAVASFSVAAKEISDRIGVTCPSRDSISVISQSKCTPNDVSRMEDIIRNKLDFHHQPKWFDNSLPVTPITLLKLLHTAYSQLLCSHMSSSPLPDLLPLIYKLEMVMCDTRSANYRPSLLVLALLKTQVNSDLNTNSLLQPLLSVCKISLECLQPIETLVSSILFEYDDPKAARMMSSRSEHSYYNRQRLVWKLSNRTLRQLKPTSKLRKYSRLSTIVETAMDETVYFPVAWKNRSPLNNFRSTVIKPTMNKAYRYSNKTGSTAHAEDSIEKVQDATEEKMETEEVNDKTQEENRVEDKTSNDEQVEKMEAEEVHGLNADKPDVENKEDCSSSEEVKAEDDLNVVEESYCQVAKKMREDLLKKATPKTINYNVSLSNVNKMITFSPPPYSTALTLQSSPLSKITLTSQLPKKSSAVQNLTKFLCNDSEDGHNNGHESSENERFYGYHHARFVGVLEGVDGDITAVQLAQQKLNGGKRRKPKVKLGLFTQIRYDTDSLSTDTSNHSSEEDMEDSDYEKDFPPLPLPRSPLFTRLTSSSFAPHSSSYLSTKYHRRQRRHTPGVVSPLTSSPSSLALVAGRSSPTSNMSVVAMASASSNITKNKKNKNTSNKKSKKSESVKPPYSKSRTRKNMQKRARKIAASVHHQK